MVCEHIGKKGPPMIRRTIFSYYSLSIYWWMKDGDRPNLLGLPTSEVVSTFNLKGIDRSSDDFFLNYSLL